MASFNSSLFLSLLVAISAFMAAASSVEAQILPNLPSLVKVNGTVFCSVNATLSSNGTVLGNPSPFINAPVQLRCGNATVGNATTNALGIFEILIRPIQSILLIISSLFPGGPICRVVVTAPLAQCNATLPAVGNLAANVTQVAGNTLNVINLGALFFQLILNI